MEPKKKSNTQLHNRMVFSAVLILLYRRLRNSSGPGPVAFIHALTKISTPTTDLPDIQKGGEDLQATATSPRKRIMEHTQHRFYLTTPRVTNAIHHHCVYTNVAGIEVTLNNSGPSCE